MNDDIPFRRHTLADVTVARFRAADDRAELARINRLTGLSFESLPKNLLGGEMSAAAGRAQRAADNDPPAAAVSPRR